MLPPRLLLTPALVLSIAGGAFWMWRRGSPPVPSKIDSTPEVFAGVIPPSRRWRLGSEAVLVEDGTPMPVRVTIESSGGTVRLTLLANGRAVDHEIYTLPNGGVSLAEGADEQYRPPIPLVARAAGAWGWKGTLEGHGTPMPAEAKILARTTSFHLDGAAYPAVESVVTLMFGEDAKAGRTLRTVYVPGRGIVHREFGSSVRTVGKEGE